MTDRDDDPKRINMLLVPDRNTGPSVSTNHDTGAAASPHCILFTRQLTTPASSHVRAKKGFNRSPTSVTGRRTRQRGRPQVSSSHRRLCGFFSARVADGKFRCACGAEKRTPPSFLPERAPAWWRRMQSPACGTSARRHGHQISVDPVQRRR